MIDLSFLTQEESEKIMAVLKRDAELKKAEEKRIQNLQRTVADKSQLKCLTGEWFYESKQLRHQECIHGSDIIRASIRRKSIPLTKVEVSHTLTKKSSFGTNERKGASEPSSPCRLREEPNIAGYLNRDLQETSSNAAEVVLQSRPKWRQNPFNSEHTEAINSQQLDGEMDLTLSENKTVSEQYYPQPLITAESGLVLAAHKRGSIEKSDEVKRSPLKTLHPRVLPKETTPKEPNPESNPFRTFPIDLNVKPQTTAELESKPSAGMRPRTGSSQTIMPSKLNPFEDITPPPLTLEVIDGETCHGQAKQPSISTSTFSSESNKTSEAMAPFTQLARAFIPQDNQHYLGPQEKAHIPSFQAVEHAGEETDAADKMIKAPSASSGNQSDQNSLSYAENIEISAWTKLSSRNLTSSRSLENLTSETTLALSSFSTMKSSVSSLSLQPQKMSSSRSSIYPLDTEVQGSIQFAVNYIQKLEEFQVFVVNCRGLAIAETKKNLSDPYVKCYLAPDKTRLGKKKTTVKKRTLNPTYNEVLKFKIPLEELKKQTLIVSVWHNDLFGRNSFLGDVDLNLSEWDFKNAEINEYKLKAKVSTEVIRGSHFGLQQNGGKMRVALRFIPKKIKSKGISTTEAGELLIWVKDCKDLPQVRRVIINPFVKCTVLPDTSRKSQQKTRVVKRTANPLFNHTMVYDGFQSEDLRQACVEITVWDRDRLHNHFIGGVRLGPGTGKSYGVDVAWMDSTTTEVNLWNKMLHSNGEWVEDVLPLRMLVMANGL